MPYAVLNKSKLPQLLCPMILTCLIASVFFFTGVCVTKWQAACEHILWDGKWSCFREDVVFSLLLAGLVLFQILGWNVCNAEQTHTHRSVTFLKLLPTFVKRTAFGNCQVQLVWKRYTPSDLIQNRRLPSHMPDRLCNLMTDMKGKHHSFMRRLLIHVNK